MPSALTRNRCAPGSRADRAPPLHRAVPEAMGAHRSASDASEPARAAGRIFDRAARLGV